MAILKLVSFVNNMCESGFFAKYLLVIRLLISYTLSCGSFRHTGMRDVFIRLYPRRKASQFNRLPDKLPVFFLSTLPHLSVLWI